MPCARTMCINETSAYFGRFTWSRSGPWQCPQRPCSSEAAPRWDPRATAGTLPCPHDYDTRLQISLPLHKPDSNSSSDAPWSPPKLTAGQHRSGRRSAGSTTSGEREHVPGTHRQSCSHSLFRSLWLPPLRLQVVLEAFLNLLNCDVGLGHALVAANTAAKCSVLS